MTPDISIVIPVYNTKEYLTRCVSSLTGQTHANLEICLVDDGSTDGSGRLCDEFAAQDPRIRVLHKENEGQGVARNVGIRMAEGEFVAFLDSDDYWGPDGCRKILERLRETGADLCAFGYCKEDENGNLLTEPVVREACYRGEEVGRRFILHFFGDDPADNDLRGVSACMSCFRRSILLEHGISFASERKVLSEDTVFNLEFCRYCETAVTLPAVIYHYVMRKASHTHRTDEERLDRTLDFCRLLRKYAEEYDISELPGVRIRMQNTVWISVMEMIRQYAGAEHGIRKIHAFLQKREVQENAAYMAKLPMNRKQKVLCSCIRWKLSFAVYLMGRLHA